MGKLLLVILLGLLSSTTFSQKFVDVIAWEADTKSGGKFIGIADDEYEAENVIDYITYHNSGTKYEVVGNNIKAVTVAILDPDKTVFDDFISQNDMYEYKYVSEIELISLQYIEDNNMSSGVSFYRNASSMKNEETVKKRLEVLYTNYSKYLFNTQEPAALVGYSE